MPDRQTCVECGKQSPETETNYTLISAQFGWRLSRSKAPDGGLLIEWRCPTCWTNFKRARGAPAPGNGAQAPAPQRPSPVSKGSGSGRPAVSAGPKSDVDVQSPSQRARRRPPR